MIQEYEDLKTLCKNYNVQGLNLNRIKLFAESHENVEYLVDPYVIQVLNESQNYLECLEISDCYNNVLNKGNTIKIIVNLGKLRDSDFGEVKKLLKLFFYIIDKLEEYKPSKKILEKY